jgi:hypothetical protein
MKTYARIDGGRVVEIIEPATYDIDWLDDNEDVIHKAGDDIPIEQRFTPEFVLTLVDVTDISPQPIVCMVYDGHTFSEYVPPAPSAVEILATNTRTRDALLARAAAAIAPLQDAVDLDEATAAETALLKQWKQYRVAVNRIDLTNANPAWPITPSA